MASKTPGSSTVRKTLLDFGIDPKAKADIASLIKQLQTLERTSTEASKQLNKNLSKIKNTPEDRAVLSGNAKNEVFTQRKILDENTKTARTILDQISKAVGQGFSPKQRDELVRGMSAAMGEITGRFTKSVKAEAKKQSKKLSDFYADEFRKNPTIPKQRLNSGRIKSLSQDKLATQLEATKLYRQGALNALSKGDPVVQRRAERALEKLDLAIRQATPQLEKLKKQTNETVKAQKKAQDAAAVRAKREAVPATRRLRAYQSQEFTRTGKNVDRSIPEAGTIKRMSQVELERFLRSAGVYRKANEKALGEAATNKDKQLRDAANKSLRALETRVEEATKQLNKFQKQTKETVREQAKAEREARERAKRESVAANRRLTQYQSEAFRRNPTVTTRGWADPSKMGSYSKVELDGFKASAGIYKQASQKALNDAVKSGDSKLEAAATKSLTELNSRIKATDRALDELKKAAEDASQSQKKATKASKPESNLTDEQKRVNRRVEQIRQTRTNNRLDGGANLFRNQGMLLRNYAVMGAGVGAIGTSATFSVELDRQFKQLQSIVNLTNDEMEELSKNLIDVSEKTKFTATQVADAAITLGQAGMGQKDIQNAIEGVTLFATAVGSDLKSAVDLATSTLGVFNKDSSQMLNIVDKMTSAVNSSKLNLDKLALGLQYSGNLAAQSNVTFEETVSALGAMANSGIRAGSTLGTGLRQIIIALQKPSEAFVTTIHNLGLSMSDLDINTHGLIPVMETLAQSGFTVRDAMETMQVRAASAYGAFSNNVDVAKDLSEQMLIGGSASRANATQMESLSNQLDRLGSISKSIVYESLEPMFDTIAKLTEKTADFLSVVRDLGPALSAIAVPLSVLGSVLAARSVLKLGAGLLGSKSILGGAKNMMGSKSMIGSRGPLATMGRIGSRFGAAGIAKYALRAIPGVGVATALGTAGIYGYKALDDQARTQDRVDLTQAAVNRSAANTESYEKQLDRVSDEIDNLILKQYELADNDALRREIRRLNEEFRQQGLYIDSSVNSYSELITKMKEFEGTTSTSLRFLQDDNRNKYTDSSTAKINNLFAGSLFESKTDEIAREGFSDRRFKSVQNRLIEKAIPGFEDSLSQLNDMIKNIAPGTEGSFERSTAAREKAQQLQSQLFGVINQSPQGLNELMASFNIQKSRGDIEAFIGDLAVSMQNRAFTLLEIEKDQKTYQGLDPEILKREKQFYEVIEKNRRAVIDDVADTTHEMSQLKEKNIKVESRDLLTTFYQIEELAREKLQELVEGEKAVLEELKKMGLSEEEANVILQQSGYFKQQGEARNKLQKTLVTAAQDAQPDANKTFSAEQAQLEADLKQKMDRLRNVTDPDKSNNLLEEVKNLISQLEESKAREDNFAATLKGESLPAIMAREAQADKVTRERQQDATKIQERTLNRSALTQAMKDREVLPMIKFQELNDDDELTRLLSDFASTERAEITNTLEEVRKESEKKRREAEVKSRSVTDYLNIANNEGYTDERREQALSIANGLQTEVNNLNDQASEMEEQGIRVAKDALAELAMYIRTQIIDNPELTDGRAKTKAGKINEDLDTQNISLQEQIQALVTQREDDDFELSEFRDQLEILMRGIHISKYESASMERLKGRINEDSFLPPGSKAYDDQYLRPEGADPVTLTDRIGNAGEYVQEEVQKSYEGFEMLSVFTAELTEAAKSMGDAFGSAMTQVVTGTATAGDALKGFFKDFAVQIADMANRALANQLMSSLFGGLGGGGSIFSSLFGGSNGMYTGGPVIAGNYATGGLITQGMDTRDSTYAHVSRGEFVLRKRAVDALGLETVRALNAADPSSVSDKENMAQQAASSSLKSTSSERGVANFYAVLPDEVPESLGPNDVIMTVADNYRKGGVLKKLIATKEI